MNKKVPLIAGLFSWPAKEPRLIAGKCKRCGSVSFPKLPYCPNPDCEKRRENVAEILLSRRGTLWSYTRQIYPPPAPFRYEPFKPFAIGMVDFPEGVRVLGMITRLENLQIGMPVETAVATLYQEGENEYITWMWNPVE